jgi:hypothetical protein
MQPLAKTLLIEDMAPALHNISIAEIPRKQKPAFVTRYIVRNKQRGLVMVCVEEEYKNCLLIIIIIIIIIIIVIIII